MKRTLIVTVLFVLVMALGFSQQESFNKANTFYNNEEYENAIASYEDVLNSGLHSASLYYNLANAHYKLNHIAESIYYYEKALQLDPDNEDVQNNLAFAKKMTIDAIEVIPQSGFSKFYNRFVGTFHYDTWAKIAVGFSFLFLICFILYYTSISATKKRSFFLISLGSVLAMLIALLFSFQQENFYQKNTYGIVFAKESSIKSEPKQSANESFKLHEGTKVKLLEAYGNWNKIKLTDGKVGWIPTSDVKAL